MTAIRRLAGGSRTCRLRAMSAVVAVVLATALGSVSASAADDGWTRSTNSYDFVQWDCGYPVRVVGTESHVVKTKVDKKLPGVSYVTDRFEFSEVWTAPDGRWFTLSGHGVNKDKKGRLVGGSVYQFAFVVRGQPMTITDSSGVVVLRDRGTLTFDYTIDLADGTFTFLEVRIRGPHPIFEAGVCKSAAPLIGTDSARHLTPRPIGSTSFPMGFYEYLPPSYQAAGSRSPLLLAFNGYGENGDGTAAGLTTLLGTGIPRFIDIGGWPTDRPLVVLALQHVEAPPGFDFSPCDGVEWGGSCSMQLQHDRNNASPAFCTTPDEIHDFITYAVAHYNVDPARVYVTGLSCGAYGVWEYLAKYGNERVAAAVPIAGDGRPAWPATICGLSSIALWAFHGALDDVVNPQGSIEPMTKLAACPGVSADRAKLTVYPDLFHDGWDQAYSGSLGDDIYTWMLGFSKQ
jgi:dienelactone hydrolase